MYKNALNRSQTKMEFLDFPNPFGQKLLGNNRWVRLSRLIPWDKFEAEYAGNFGNCGPAAYPFRVALGSEIIKERLGISDRELVDQISENPYLQYFLGFPRFQTAAPFDPSTLVHFRKRLTPEMLKAINEHIATAALKSKDDASKAGKPPIAQPPSDTPQATKNEQDEVPPAGKLLMDATCAPEDIRFPSDLSLLNEAREATEAVIDSLWESCPAHLRPAVKPRTYRKKARKHFLEAIRSRKLTDRRLRRALRYQLGCIRRNQRIIMGLSQKVSLMVLSKHTYRSLLVVAEVYRQQRQLFSLAKGERRSVPDRIVSICKPHVRPIVRGKAAASVEFGAKLSISVIDGFSFVDRHSWDAYNECGDLAGQAEAFRRRTGHWPASVHADKIYRTRDNLEWCRERNIRLSGPLLGRPPVDADRRKAILKLQRQDETDRIPVEGRFGVAKRRYSLARIMRRLKETSESAVAMIFLLMNLDKILRDLLAFLFFELGQETTTVFNSLCRRWLVSQMNLALGKPVIFALNGNIQK
jgi:hypothetical protein